jgi:methylenetetrahydrofolate dehydrogenase (NADP+)/methenyltetrahydrofolate cyclohydrolase
LNYGEAAVTALLAMAPTRIIDGARHAADLKETLARQIASWVAATGNGPPMLAAVLVGDDPASAIYVRRKSEAAHSIGMASRTLALPADTSEAALLALVERLNRDRDVHGILVQLPLPDHIDKNLVLETIDPAKDVDGFHPENVGRLSGGASGFIPCTPRGCMMLIESEVDTLEGLNAVVIGCSNIVGRPVAQLLLRARATVSIAHIYTCDLPRLVATADILVAAAGAPGLVRGSWLKPGAIVIDVGINRVPRGDSGSFRIVGDVRFDEALGRAGAITPVPGGVGPMTIACLLDNSFRAAMGLAEKTRAEQPDNMTRTYIADRAMAPAS